MLNILVLSTWSPYPLDNGSRIRVHYLVRALSDRHQVTLVAFEPTAKLGEKSEAPKIISGAQIVHVADDPYRNTSLPALVKYLSPIPVTLWPNRLMARTVHRLDHESTWDAVVAVQSPVARYALSVPTLVRIFDVDAALSYTMYQRFKMQSNLSARTRTWLSWQKAERYEARLVRSFDICAVASAHELNHLRLLIGGARSEAVVVPNGVDCARNQPNCTPKISGRLVFNGSLTYGANHDAMRFFLSEVYPKIRATSPDVTMVITGSTRGVDLAELALHDSVHLTGFVDDVRIPVAEATVCVVPIREGGGTRLKILEAMALGTPVITTAKGAEGLDVVDGKHLLVADEPEAFAHRTIELLGNAELRRQLATSARCLVEEQYDWQAIGAQFANLIEDATRK